MAWGTATGHTAKTKTKPNCSLLEAAFCLGPFFFFHLFQKENIGSVPCSVTKFPRHLPGERQRPGGSQPVLKCFRELMCLPVCEGFV